MALLKIAKMGHPVLASTAESVNDPLAPEIKDLISSMIETMYDADGTGLAAPQVYVPKRIVVFFVDSPSVELEKNYEPDSYNGSVPLTVLINPEIEPLSDEISIGWEGCLSVPEMLGAVPRYNKIRYRGTSTNGELIDRIAHGFHARVVQHECDHLDGFLYPMRIKDLKLFGFAKEMRSLLSGNENSESDNALDNKVV